MNDELAGRRDVEQWIAWVRLAAVPFALVEVGVLTSDFPDGYETWAWVATAALAVGAVVLFFLSRSELFDRAPRRIGFLALAFDTVVLSAFVLIYQFEIGSPVRQVFYVLLVEARCATGSAAA